jgi:hypothetical protein
MSCRVLLTLLVAGVAAHLSGCSRSSSLACTSGPGCPVIPSGPTCSSAIVGSSLTAGVYHFGTVAVGTVVPVPVPAGTTGLTFVEQAVSAPGSLQYRATTADPWQTIANNAGPDYVYDATGATFYDGWATPPADGNALSLFLDSSSPTVGTLTIPNTTAALAAGNLVAGTWHFRVSDWGETCVDPVGSSGSVCTGGSSASTYDVTAIVRTGAIPAAGNVAVAFYLIAPLTAATAGTSASLQRMVSSLRTLLGRANLTVGSVAWHDLPAEAQVKYAAQVDATGTGGCDDVGRLFQYGLPGHTLNLFLVPKINLPTQAGSGTSVVGLDGTIPGPSSFGGTVQSGALVSFENLDYRRLPSACSGAFNPNDCGADLTAYVAAHEVGHFLGLYHTTEADGMWFDPLTDTPRCPCSTCAPATEVAKCGDPTLPTWLYSSSCTGTPAGCGGEDNLMFWLVSQLTIPAPGTISPQQAQVMRANPLVQ